MFFFFAFSAKSDDICPCQVHNGRNPGCCCSGLVNRSQYPEGCYPDFPSSIIPVCPSSHWRQSMKLQPFLSEELFCINMDNRDVSNGRSSDSFMSTNSSNYRVIYTDEINQDAVNGRYSALSIIRQSNEKYFLLPTSGATMNCVTTLPLTFLQTVENSQCTVTTPISIRTYSTLQIPSIPGNTTTFATLTFNDGTNTYTSETVPDTTISKLSLVIRYAPDTTHEIREIVFNYVADPNPTIFTLNVNFVEDGAEQKWNSGEIGYSRGSPVIAGHYENGVISLSTDYSQNILPVTLGLDCSSAMYTPLKFGMDTMGGCGTGTSGQYPEGTNPLINPRRLNAFAKHSNPDPEKLDDWYILNELDFDGCTDNSNYQYVFYTSKAGTSKRTYELINKVKLTCLPDSEDKFTMTAAFIEVPQKVERNIGEFPIWLIELPNDTWHPFA